MGHMMGRWSVLLPYMLEHVPPVCVGLCVNWTLWITVGVTECVTDWETILEAQGNLGLAPTSPATLTSTKHRVFSRYVNVKIFESTTLILVKKLLIPTYTIVASEMQKRHEIIRGALFLFFVIIQWVPRITATLEESKRKNFWLPIVELIICWLILKPNPGDRGRGFREFTVDSALTT